MRARRRERKLLLLHVGAVEEKERRKVKVGGVGIDIAKSVRWMRKGGNRSSRPEPPTNIDEHSSVLAAVRDQEWLVV